MRKTLLALLLALAACLAASHPTVAMDGFDLGDMPPLPPPLLDDSTLAPTLAPPGSGQESPLASPLSPPPAASGMPSSPLGPPPAMTPIPPTPVPDTNAGSYSAPAGGGYGLPAGGTPLPPPPPPLAPPPVDGGIGGGMPEQAGTASSPAQPGSLVPPPLASQPPDTQEVVGLADNETPRAAQITGGRVNVRAGPNTQYESIAVLTTGTPLTVLAKNGDWYKIMYPSEHLASIHRKFVTAEIPSEIPEEGIAGVVNRDNTDVHAFYWDKSTVVGKLNKGAPVIIKQERGQWYRIVAPLNARAYVFAKYVKLDGDTPVVADTAPLPPNASVDVTAVGPDGTPTPKPKPSSEEEKVRELKEARAKQSQAQLERLRLQEEALRKQQEERDREMDRRQKEAEEMVKARAQADLQARMLQANQLDAALRDLDSRLTAIDGEKTRQAHVMGRRFGQEVNPITQVGSAATWAPPDPPTGGYVGWIENIGRVGGAPSPYRLTKGGEIRFWLVSEKHDLDRFANLRVICDGEIIHAGGTTASILKVDKIRQLTEWEIAGSPVPLGPNPGVMPTPGPGRPTQQARPGMPGQPGFPGQPGPGMQAGRPGQPGFPQQPRQPEQPYVDPYAHAVDVTDYDQPGFEQAPPPTPAPTASALDRDPLAGSTYVGNTQVPNPYAQSQGYGMPAAPYTPPAAPYGYGYGGGSQYGAPSPMSDDNVGTADLVTSVESVFGSGGYPPPSGGVYGGGTYDSYGTGGYSVPSTGSYDGSYGTYDSGGGSFPNAQPATGLIRASDSSQLPDTVGGLGSYSTSAGLVSGEGVGMGIGEVETDIYERPIINEILP